MEKEYLELDYDACIDIYPPDEFAQEIELYTGHEINRYLKEHVEGWKGDPERDGVTMYFYEGQREESDRMRDKVVEALTERRKQVRLMKSEIDKYKMR